MPTIEFTDHTADVMSITINPENKKVFVSGSCDTTAKIWDTRNRNPQMTFSSETLDGHAHERLAVGWRFGQLGATRRRINSAVRRRPNRPCQAPTACAACPNGKKSAAVSAESARE